MPQLDINVLRADTPACAKLIHFNNAGAALLPRPVSDAVIAHLELEQEIGGYEAADAAHREIGNFYHAFARLLNCDPGEIAYVESATRAWDMLAYAIPFQPGDRVLTGQAEYVSNYLALLQLAQRRKIVIDVVGNDASGRLDLEEMRQKIGKDVRLIALTHVPSQGGVIQPAEAVGRLAREHGIHYLLDACQSAGQLELDVAHLGCDMLTGTGRKFLRGPRGTGFLYVSRAIIEKLEPPFVDLHSARWTARDKFEFSEGARRFEAFECYVAGKIGLGVAVDYALGVGLDRIAQRVQFLAQDLRQKLRNTAGVTVHEANPGGATLSGAALSETALSGIVTFNKADEAAQQLMRRLRAGGINTSVTPLGSALLDFEQRGLENVNRASLHYYNTRAEIDAFCAALAEGAGVQAQ